MSVSKLRQDIKKVNFLYIYENMYLKYHINTNFKCVQINQAMKKKKMLTQILSHNIGCK